MVHDDGIGQPVGISTVAPPHAQEAGYLAAEELAPVERVELLHLPPPLHRNMPYNINDVSYFYKVYKVHKEASGVKAITAELTTCPHMQLGDVKAMTDASSRAGTSRLGARIQVSEEEVGRG
eukprot:scaffold140273_cov19-Tisochrysis_lutea.AAC.2